VTYPVGSRVAFRGLNPAQAKFAAELYHREHGRDFGTGMGMVMAWGGCAHESASFVVLHVDYVGDHKLECEECGTVGWANPSWVELAGLPVSPCSCDLRRGGCGCGAFEREQEAKGMRKNPVTRMWERAS